ncbi:MAG: hypothetical protein KF723_07560 [Rhizobiaceae bacterium]|nr:hypothetical protein [Rhizobiaceae bacterium]
MVSETTARQRAFFDLFAGMLPALAARCVRGNESTRWLAVGPRPYVVAHFFANKGAGIFVRGARGVRTAVIREELFPHREFLARELQWPDLKLGTYFPLARAHRADMLDSANWPAAIEWLGRMSPVYERALTQLRRRW